MAQAHQSVMLREAVDALSVKAGGRYVDGTFGRGGHAREIARRGGEVLGIDRDAEAVAAADGLHVVRGNHGDIKRLTHENGWDAVDGILLDLGVSSPQLDEAGRGFSFMRDGPLDMRMDTSRGLTAADLVNREDATRLEEIFHEWGEEPQARRIARAIVKAREERGPIRTTLELAELIERTVGRHGPHHPATRVFQALRMEVNDEMGELNRALTDGLELLSPGGRIVVITFESLTDRAVKRFFAAHVGKEVSLQQGGVAWQGEEPRAHAVLRKALTAGEDEVQGNPRARSAKLRAIERE